MIDGTNQPAGDRRQPGPSRADKLIADAGYHHLPGTTLTRYCSSSLQTTRMAMHASKAGEGQVFISAGVETVSRHVKCGGSE